ncbi:unnamed protein product [Ilex paraguariensis]|uniref:Uncharacterized protein n=1 Tax=Ilex paraguariensis TaxID=185542 RepID=A0ABC8R2B1_9AQUA
MLFKYLNCFHQWQLHSNIAMGLICPHCSCSTNFFFWLDSDAKYLTLTLAHPKVINKSSQLNPRKPIFLPRSSQAFVGSLSLSLPFFCIHELLKLHGNGFTTNLLTLS